MKSACSSLATTTQQSTTVKPGPSSQTSFVCRISKQYMRDKPVRWGIKGFLLCEAKTVYILDTESYTGRVKDGHWPLLGSASSVVHRLVENTQVANKNHMLFMDDFYNAVTLFHLLKNDLGDLAAGTVMPSPKELGPRNSEADRTWPVQILVSVRSLWHRLKDCNPICFLSYYQDPRRASTVNGRVGHRPAELTTPQPVVDYTR